MNTTIAVAWEGFAQAVLPDDVPEIQRKEMRRAFYAGAWAMWLLAANIGSAAISEDAGIQMFEDWNQELQRFQTDVKEGRA